MSEPPGPAMTVSEWSQGWLPWTIVVVLLWECAKSILNHFLRHAVSSDKLVPGFGQDVSDDLDDMEVPREPHVEIALDPPCGLHLGNPKELYTFENEYCSGVYFLMHPPFVGGSSQGPNGMNYIEYFNGKSRLWEVRVQMQFKKPPTPETEMFFGVELEEYVPLNMATRQAQNLITSAMRQAVGGVYQSPGDNPARCKGEIELPVCVLPLWAFDQFIETPEGQEPPSLTDPDFSQLGTKRYSRVAEYVTEMADLQRNWKQGTTYTFAFWGVSRFLDVINWMVIGIPVATPIDFNKFAGRPPVRVSLYALMPGEGDSAKDKRHLQSRKRYYFRAAIWSSQNRPERSRIEALTGLSRSAPGLPGQVLKAKSIRRRFTSFLKHSVLEPVTCSCSSGNRKSGS